MCVLELQGWWLYLFREFAVFLKELSSECNLEILCSSAYHSEKIIKNACSYIHSFRYGGLHNNVVSVFH
jgi:hypothetical protein